MNIIKFDFKGQKVGFNDEGWINATDAASKFNKKPIDWIKQDEIHSYLLAVAEYLNCDPQSLLKTKRGRYGSGTWLHPKLAVRFSQWLDVKFAVWCDMQIDNLLRTQTVNYTNEQIIAILTHSNPQSWEKRFQAPFYKALSKMTNLPYYGHNGGCPALFGKITSDWVYRVVLPDPVYKNIKERMSKGEKVHQFLKDDALKAVEEQLTTITAIAKGCIDYKDFEARCSTIFNVNGQIKLILAA